MPSSVSVLERKNSFLRSKNISNEKRNQLNPNKISETILLNEYIPYFGSEDLTLEKELNGLNEKEKKIRSSENNLEEKNNPESNKNFMIGNQKFKNEDKSEDKNRGKRERKEDSESFDVDKNDGNCEKKKLNKKENESVKDRRDGNDKSRREKGDKSGDDSEESREGGVGDE